MKRAAGHRRAVGVGPSRFPSGLAVALVLLGLIAAAYLSAAPEELTYDAQIVIGKNPMIEPSSPW